jgi:hypothetical protein
MRKTARPVVWEGAGAQSQALHPINLQNDSNGEILHEASFVGQSFVAAAMLKKHLIDVAPMESTSDAAQMPNR